jgi:hypothetical protein
MKASGNITIGKTVERHITEGSLTPGAVVKFYGKFAPARYEGQDVKVIGWVAERGGYNLIVTTGKGFRDSVRCPEGSKVGVYADQADALADFSA